MIRVGICNDEKMQARDMERAIVDICTGKQIPVDVAVFSEGKFLEKEIAAGAKFDLLYMDIQMLHGDGITTIKNIRKTDENVLIIFVSEYDRYGMELFRLDVFAFVKKPIDRETFERTFLEAYQKICKKAFYYTFHFRSREYKIPCNEILYFESKGRQIKIYLKGYEKKEFLYNGKLSEVENRLAEGKIPFLRIHQSYLVNYHLIRSRTMAEVTLVNGITLPVSEDRRKEFNCKYNRLLREEID